MQRMAGGRLDGKPAVCVYTGRYHAHQREFAGCSDRARSCEQGATLRAHERVAKLAWGSGYPALRTPLDDSMAARLTRLMRRIAPDLSVTPSMGGSLPLHEFGSRLSAPIAILPLANHDNNQHAENENVRLQNLWGAMRIYGAVLAAFGER